MMFSTAMRSSLLPLALALSACCTSVPDSTESPAAPGSTAQYTFERGTPTGSTAEDAYYASDLRRAIEAYKFFYPTMGAEAVMQQMLSNGAKINEVGHVMATWPRIQFGAANSDTPYALATLDLKVSGPMVIELPPGPFIGFVDDHNMRWVQDMGIIGPEKGKGGKHLVLPPDYEGEVPSGYYAARSKTWQVVAFIRLMPIGGDVAKALAAANDIKIYPLAQAGQAVPFRYIDVSSYTLPLPILAWEKHIEYFRQLHAVIQTETAPAENRPMLGMLAQLGIKKGKPFDPDARMQRLLEEAAQTANAEMRANFYAQRDPEFIAWEGRAWEWLIVQVISPETRDFGDSTALNLEASDAYYFMGYGASAAMGKPAVGAGSVYWGAYRDGTGAYLDGGKTYKLTVPAPVPATLFWSSTVYDVDTRTLIATDQDRAAVRSHLEFPQANADGSFDLYFGPKAPAGKEGMWIKTIPGKGWWCAFRIYGPQAPAFDGTWKLDDIVEVK
jgi:hypothetical protein